MSSAFRKLSPSELESRGLSRKSERYLAADGTLLSKRQYQKALGIGQYQAPERKVTIKALAAKARWGKADALNRAKADRALQEYGRALRHYTRDKSGFSFKKPPSLRDFAKKQEISWRTFTRLASESGAIQKTGGRWQYHHTPSAGTSAPRGFVGFFARVPDGDPARYFLILDEATRSNVGRWLNNQVSYHNRSFRDVNGDLYYISEKGEKASREWKAQNVGQSPVRYLGDRMTDQ